jgi:hypothetical protein
MHLLGVLATHTASVPPLLQPFHILILEEKTLCLLALSVLTHYLPLCQRLHLHLPQGLLA